MIDLSDVDLGFLTRAEDLPSLPAVAIDVVRLTQREEVDLERIGDTVGQDPALAGRLLKLANSPLFGRAQEVTTIQQALMVLGLRTVRMAAISFSVGAALGQSSGGFGTESDYQGYWRRSVAGAVAARQLCGVPFPQLAEEAFLAALLMDVGFPTLMRSGYEPYEAVMESTDLGHPCSDLERTVLSGISHAEVSAHVMKKWGLPTFFAVIAAHHHDPEGLPQDTKNEVRYLTRLMDLIHDVATVMTSSRLCGAALLSARSKAAALGVSDERLDEVMKGLGEHVEGMARLMEVDVGSAQEMAVMLIRAQEDMLTMAVGATAELERNKKKMRELEKKAETDSLTRVGNRSAFEELIAEEWRSRLAGQEKRPLGLIIADIDAFKLFNDAYGHQAGDEVLKHVARSLADNCRTKLTGHGKPDIVCRYGGEEFVIVAHCESLRDLSFLAERLRASIASLKVPTLRGELSVTASFGGSWLSGIPPGVTSADLFACADKNLYVAKDAGRNCCRLTQFTGVGTPV